MSAPRITRSDLSDPGTPRSRGVSVAEYDQLARLGAERLATLRQHGTPPTAGIFRGVRWTVVKVNAWLAVRRPWGGLTVDARTAIPVTGEPDRYALTAREPGHDTVRIPIDADRFTFLHAMETARSRFTSELSMECAHLGIFRDDGLGTIDIDPVLVVDTLADAESIAIATRALGGAYRFSDGLGYWPPHVEEGASS